MIVLTLGFLSSSSVCTTNAFGVSMHTPRLSDEDGGDSPLPAASWERKEGVSSTGTAVRRHDPCGCCSRGGRASREEPQTATTPSASSLVLRCTVRPCTMQTDSHALRRAHCCTLHTAWHFSHHCNNADLAHCISSTTVLGESEFQRRSTQPAGGSLWVYSLLCTYRLPGPPTLWHPSVSLLVTRNSSHPAMSMILRAVPRARVAARQATQVRAAHFENTYQK